LTIASVAKCDAGKYSISARNSLGRQLHSVEILIDCPENSDSDQVKNGHSFASNLVNLDDQLPKSPAMPSLSYDKINEKNKKVKNEKKITRKSTPKEEDPVAPPPIASAGVEHVSSDDEPRVPPPVDRLRSKTVTPDKEEPSLNLENQGPTLIKGLESGCHERDDYIVLEVEFKDADSVDWRLNGSSDISGVVRPTANGSKLRIRSFDEKDTGDYEAIATGANGQKCLTSCTLSLRQSSQPQSKHGSPEIETPVTASIKSSEAAQPKEYLNLILFSQNKY